MEQFIGAIAGLFVAYLLTELSLRTGLFPENGIPSRILYTVGLWYAITLSQLTLVGRANQRISKIEALHSRGIHVSRSNDPDGGLQEIVE